MKEPFSNANCLRLSSGFGLAHVIFVIPAAPFSSGRFQMKDPAKRETAVSPGTIDQGRTRPTAAKLDV